MSSSEPATHLQVVGDDPPRTMGELAHRRAAVHNARADLAAAQRQADEVIESRHAAYMAEGRRRLERLQLEQTLEAVAWSRVQAPPGSSFDMTFSPPKSWSVRPDEEEDLDASPGPDQAPDVDLDAAARELFDRLPDAGRSVVMRELGIDEYPAKKLIERRKAGRL